jgi:hypothetical protein
MVLDEEALGPIQFSNKVNGRLTRSHASRCFGAQSDARAIS